MNCRRAFLLVLIEGYGKVHISSTSKIYIYNSYLPLGYFLGVLVSRLDMIFGGNTVRLSGAQVFAHRIDH
jgi:hypothetical protein